MQNICPSILIHSQWEKEKDTATRIESVDKWLREYSVVIRIGRSVQRGKKALSKSWKRLEDFESFCKGVEATYCRHSHQSSLGQENSAALRRRKTPAVVLWKRWSSALHIALLASVFLRWSPSWPTLMDIARRLCRTWVWYSMAAGELVFERVISAPAVLVSTSSRRRRKSNTNLDYGGKHDEIQWRS